MHTLAILQLILPAALLVAQAPAPAVVERDLVYGQAEGVDLKLDFVRPGEGAGPFPLVVCVHGGAWSSGSKSGHAMVLQLLAQNGYAAASIDYRLAPRFQFPAQIQDVRQAVAYLRGRAAELKIDPERVATLGDSAGGHLALLMGLSDPKDKIRAVVNLFGPTDIQRWQATPEGEAGLGVESGKLIQSVFGTGDRTSATLKAASPLFNISNMKTAVLTLHGDADPVVKVEQAQWLHEALAKAGVQEKLIVLKGGGHALAGPNLQTAIAAVLEFLGARLKAAPGPA